MKNFPKIAATARSLAKRKPIYEHGINDAWFIVKPMINGRQVTYEPYQIWKSMVQRCYSVRLQNKFPTYRGCIVCKEWLTFSNFEAWMLTQDWQGKEIDKDIIRQGNKIYSSTTCRFITHALNSLLNAKDAARGDLPLGVDLHKASKKYRTKISINGKQKLLGYFKTAQDAKSAYDSAKYNEIHRQAMLQTDPEIKAGLMNWVVE